MTSRNPSFITKSRHGIWYFQVWIPTYDDNGDRIEGKLFRRSLKTRSRRAALALARRWWILMTDRPDYDLDMDELERIEDGARKQAFMYRLGEKVTKEMQSIGFDINNSDAVDSYFEVMPPQHEEAFWLYQDLSDQAKKNKLLTPESLEKQGLADEIVQKLTSFSEKPLSKEENPTVEELVKLWLEECSTMSPSSYPEYERMTTFFSRVLTELNGGESPRISTVTKFMIRKYKKIIKNLPRNVKTGNLSLVEIERLSGPKKRESTVRHYYTNITTFLLWIKDEEHFPVDAEIVDLMRPKKRRSRQLDDSKKRLPHSPDALVKLFQSKKYVHGRFKNAADFWAPLIAIYTGASLGEILQLYVEDIHEDEGIVVFDFNEDFDKRLKRPSRKRLVPIHTQLIKLGILEYRDKQELLGNKRLFPAEYRNGAGKFGAFSRRFSTYRKSVNVGPKNADEFRDFHSFRHLVRTKFASLPIETVVLDEIGGWSSGFRSIGEKVYSHSERVSRKKKAIEMLNYDLNFQEIRAWEHHLFMRISNQLVDWDKK